MKFNLVSVEPAEFGHAGSWYELAELVLYGLQRAGFDCTTSINKFSSRRTNIVFGTQHVAPELSRLVPKDTFFFNTEQLPILSQEFCHQAYMHIRYWAQRGHRFLDYSSENIEILKAWGASEVVQIPLGYVPELERLEQTHPEYDYLFYGGLNSRRIEMIQQIQEQGLKLRVLNGLYGDARDTFIQKSKVVLNLHLYESEIFEIVRANYLMHNQICLLTEINSSTKIEKDLPKLFVCADRAAMASTAAELIENPTIIEQKALAAHDWLRSRPQEIIMKSIF